MPVDANIISGLQQPQFMTPMQAASNALTMKQQLQSAQLNQMRLLAGEHTLRDQMLLANTAAQPGAIDSKTGLWSQDALNKIVQESPQLGASLVQKQAKDKLTIEQMSLDQSKEAADNRKLWTGLINDAQEEAVSVADQVPPSQREEAYQKKWAEGREQLKQSGYFPDNVKFNDMSYGAAKDILARRKAGGKENLLQQVGEAEDTLNEWKNQYSRMDANSPEAKQQLQKIRVGEQAIARMKAPTNPMISLGGKPPSGYRWSATQPGELEKIPGGPADKPTHDVLQADALAAYRASYPMGYMPEVYGKDQQKPDDFVADYIKGKEQGTKGIPKAKPKELPSSKTDLKADTVYQTRHGPAKWDGKQFVKVE